MTAKKTITAVVVILVAIGGFVAGLLLLRQRQEIREKAAVPGGEAKVSIFPTSGNFNVGDTFPISVFFNTADIAISGISVRLTYQYSGATPEFVASNIDINSALLASGDWTCPTRNIAAQAGNVNIDIACANVSAAGYTTSTDTLLATFNMTIERIPASEPVVLRFDSSQSVITQKSDGQDILLIPSGSGSTGEYTVTGEAPTPIPTTAPTTVPGVTSTPTPTSALAPTSTPTPTVMATPTPTTITTATPTATGAAQLPDAGVSYPTFIGIGLGLFLILGALIFAL